MPSRIISSLARHGPGFSQARGTTSRAMLGSRWRMALQGLFVGGVLLTLAACAPGYPTFSPRDVARATGDPAALDVTIGIHQVASNQLMLSFGFWLNDHPVSLDNTGITCDGVNLSYDNIVVDQYSASLPIDGVITCSYQQMGKMAVSLNLVIPPSPAVIAPSMDAVLPRAAILTVAYVAQTACMMQIGVDNGIGTRSTLGPVEPDTGTALLDSRQLHAGPGTIFFQRTWDTVLTDSPFESVKVHGVMTAALPVMWR